MNWESRYLPPDPIIWHGRADIPADSCFFQHIQLLNLLTQPPQRTDQLAFAILGFKCDEGVQRDLGRTGAFEGPTAIRQRLAKLPLQIANIHIYDAGNVICNDHDLEASQATLGEIVAMLLEKHIHPIVIGGGHEVSWGHYQGIAKHYSSQKKLGIINFDAHFDLHPLQPSHRSSATTTFYQIAEAHRESKRHFDYNCIGIQHAGNIRQSFDIAKQLNTKFILADELHQGLQDKCIDFVDRIIDENDMVYASLSLDVFSPAFAPGVSTIQPLGLYPWHLIPLLRQLAASGKMVSYDIAEHVPRYDIDHRTAKLAATLIYEIIHHHCDNGKCRLS
ncbi:MAG: formimidoylglutamase [uncultured bacterium]|nr:MAG: formimidoylglutamase [uncultured bacterium]